MMDVPLSHSKYQDEVHNKNEDSMLQYWKVSVRICDFTCSLQ